MTTLVKIAIAFVISLFLSSCGLDSILKNMGPGIKGNSVIVEQDRKVTEDFTTISASEGIQVYVNNTLIEASSGSKIEAKELSTVLCNAQASSGSSVTIAVTESLQANANSGGYIAYTGDPEVQKNESVSGSIRAY